MHLLDMFKLLMYLFPVCTCFVYGDTLLHLGEKSEFGSDAQIEQLQKAIKQDATGKFIALTWSLKLPSGAKAQTLLFYDREAKMLWRAKNVQVGEESMDTSWVSWDSVTDSALYIQKPTDGFELPGFKTGRGPVPLSKSASLFLTKATKGKKS